MNSSRPICVMVHSPYGKRVRLVKDPAEGEYEKIGNNLYVEVTDDGEDETTPPPASRERRGERRK